MSDPKAFAAIILYTDRAGNTREQLAVAVALTPQGAARALVEAFAANPQCASIDYVAVDPEPAPVDDVAALVSSIAREATRETPNTLGLTVPTAPASRTVH